MSNLNKAVTHFVLISLLIHEIDKIIYNILILVEINRR